MILRIENPKESTKKLLALINEFSTVVEYRINTQKSVVFVYTSSGQFAKEIKKTIPFTLASKTINHMYIGINLTKEM